LAIALSGDWCRIRIESGYHSLDCPYQTLYIPATRPLAATAGDGAAGELISHQAQAVSNRESLWAPQEINPLWGQRITGPEQKCGDGCKIGLHPLSHLFTSARRLVSPLSIFSSAFLMSSISLTVVKPLYKP